MKDLVRVEVELKRGMADEWYSAVEAPGGVVLDFPPPGMERSIADDQIIERRPVGHYVWMLPDERTKKLRRSRYRMTIQTAREEHGEAAEADWSSREVRHDVGTINDVR